MTAHYIKENYSTNLPCPAICYDRRLESSRWFAEMYVSAKANATLRLKTEPKEEKEEKEEAEGDIKPVQPVKPKYEIYYEN